MKPILSNFKIQVNENIYLKDPESSKLGRKIIDQSIFLIDTIGFEHFTFRKLAEEISSTESSVYRYFENKHQLLVYLTNWYWSWIEYKLVFSTHSIADPMQKLRLALEIITRAPAEDEQFSHVNEVKLAGIVVSEFSKSYLTKEVDQENQDGYFATYKRLVGRVSDMILEVNPGYVHPRSLISTVIQGALHQQYSREHLPSLTDCKNDDELVQFYKNLVLKQINP